MDLGPTSPYGRVTAYNCAKMCDLLRSSVHIAPAEICGECWSGRCSMAPALFSSRFKIVQDNFMKSIASGGKDGREWT